MSSPYRLLALAPLRLEVLALSGGRWGQRPGAGDFALARLGMGLSKAYASASRLQPLLQAGAVAVMGLGGALDASLAPGDLVVAQRLMDASGREVAQLPTAELLVGELRRLGLPARAGTIVSTDHIVTGPERAELAALGADVVDMESSAVASVPWDVPLAVVRAISDSPGQELFSPEGAKGAWDGLRALRASRPAVARWAEAAGPGEVVLASPRGFCAGVSRAIQTVERALALFGSPVYVRRQIVHNHDVVARLESLGAVFVEELDEVPDRATVVFSAHGVGTSVMAEAGRRQMSTVDATCPLVTKVHHEGRRFAAAGRQVVLVGHAGHDEVEGTLGTVPGARLVSSAQDVALLDLDDGAPTAFITQTTLAADDVSAVVEALEERFAQLARPAASDICYASQNRQAAVGLLADECDLVLVVGSENSSNSNRLVEVARRRGTAAHLVGDVHDVALAWLAGRGRVGVTAGASAPEHLVQQLVQALAGLGRAALSERSAAVEHVNFPLPLEVR